MVNYLTHDPLTHFRLCVRHMKCVQTATSLKEKGRGRLQGITLENEERRAVADETERDETSDEQGRDYERVQTTSGVVLWHRLRRRRQPIIVIPVVDVTQVGVTGHDVDVDDVIGRHGFFICTDSTATTVQITP